MGGETLDLTNVEPFEIVSRPDDPQSDPLELELTVHPNPEIADGDFLPHNRWAVDVSDRHINPKWEETFEVISGQYNVDADGIDRTLEDGDPIVLPPDEPHRHWNPSGQPTRIRYRAQPAYRGLEAFETLYTLAQAGKTGENEFPNFLQFAVIQDTYPGLFFSTDLPRSLQKAMFSVFGPIGRGLGYEAVHTRTEIDELRRGG